ncbi:exonuclease domain-containing protein [Tomitella cavernea]|nr:exonuclease domain-containing protein [Tomitella cavernea]
MTVLPKAHVPGLSFTAIDFETANGSRASACSVGLAKVRDGEVVDTASLLIAPPSGHDSFLPRNVAIHGITSDAVSDALQWVDVFPQIMTFVGDDDLVAHNVAFDRSVLEKSCSLAEIDWPENPWYCTLAMSKSLLTLASYRLDVVSRYLKLSEFAHHEAEADAVQAARLVMALGAQSGEVSLAGLSKRTPPTPPRSTNAGTQQDYSALVESKVLTGERIVFTGTLGTLKRAEAISLVTEAGAEVHKSVTKTTTLLVAGDFDPSRLRPGMELSRKLEKARRYAEAGQSLEILTEAELLSRIDVGRDEIERATRERRAAANSGWLPGYVIEQARVLDSTMDYNSWLRAALRHPDGRATTGTACIRCSSPVADAYWLFAERYVCSADCNEALKGKAKRMWRKEGVSRPEAPSYAESWGRVDRRK